ncbi:5-(carboxyamino)imidazole ribonucleotide synthase [Candidatus Kinetoplastibacterium blastocrithidii TCC012E]|uniref:N5-carboxyaminoimidazole ribonucleotide synthase n=1 Tax=Candidatus Kinetoplastidibacterium blastocrithidiae TCC012E TaxID=1208922 RepID=M1M322_9PROT|nr:5-(carboxyamino)imidazole ribonucleotide synthase [Candidatus Kinetoplastibacterium blastocrithidii]AFZ83483.1 5-(carboxyamino)imidazole ribonucleotide synthase [Candidatus Kinetoplastibacterium blastocrithidii (ex Strigomonas culicis)]AGF49579.1 5-(carboxyamino)imidazole ribonucleotide synthase [Candidatus Kinetoplastibacterium blastocrithidii TCC012E]
MISSKSNFYVPPGNYLGLLGGGQLGRMFCYSAQSLGYKVMVLDPDPDCPAGMVADHHIAASYSDHNALEMLSKSCRSVTIEFENIPCNSLEILSKNCVVTPSAYSVSIAQNRIKEKEFIQSQGVDVAPYKSIFNGEDITENIEYLLPGIIKVSKTGYDGKGQAMVSSLEEVREVYYKFGEVPCVLERCLSINYEASVVLSRDFMGNSVFFPISTNVHNRGILSSSLVIKNIDSSCEGHEKEQMLIKAKKIADSLNYHGVLCVEFFVLNNSAIIINEIAPRPHNSGHYTIDACVDSQFDQQVRVMAGLPLGSTKLLTSALMLNILGDSWFDMDSGILRNPDWLDILSLPGVKLHLYGKKEARPLRKMGHLTILSDNINTLEDKAKIIAAKLNLSF